MSVLCRNVLILPEEFRSWVEHVVNHGIPNLQIGEVGLETGNGKLKLFFKSNGVVSDSIIKALSLLSLSSTPIVYRAVVDIGYYIVEIFKDGKRVFYKERDVFFYNRSVA